MAGFQPPLAERGNGKIRRRCHEIAELLELHGTLDVFHFHRGIRRVALLERLQPATVDVRPIPVQNFALRQKQTTIQ